VSVHEFEGLKYDLQEGHSIDDSLLEGKCFEPWTWNWIKQYVTKESACVDVGANFGCFSVLMASLGKKVWCFEPMPIIERLICNMELNRFTNYKACQFVVGSECREVHANFQYKWDAESDTNEQVHTTMITLDDFIQGRVDFLKIDTDGDELRVIDGMRRCVGSYHPVVVQELAVDTFAFDEKTWSKERQDNTGNWKEILDFYFSFGYEIKAQSLGALATNAEQLVEIAKDPNISSIDVLLVNE